MKDQRFSKTIASDQLYKGERVPSPFTLLAYNTPGRFKRGRITQTVGVIHTVARYPVKSMRSEAHASLPLTLQGFEDRRFAFVQAESRSAFPWLTAREMPGLIRWQTSVEKPGTPEVTVTVTTPAGEQWPFATSEVRQIIEKCFGKPVFLRDYRGSFDIANVS
jgi:hypothetical protein